MPDTDTSSYPKLPANPPSFLDTAGKFQALQSNALTLQQQQLGLIQNRFKAVAGQIPGLLSKPDLNEKDIVQFYTNNQKEGLMDADTTATEIGQIPPTQGMPPDRAVATLKNWLGNKLQMAQSTMEALNYHLGQQGTVNNNAAIQPTLASPKPGFGGLSQGGVIATQPGISLQPGPTQPTVSQGAPGQPPRGTPGILGPTNVNPLPVGPRNVQGNIQGMGNVTGVTVGPDQPNMGGVPSAGLPTRVPTQAFTPTGNPPLFEAGKTQLAQDQQIAAQKSQSLIPILQAIPLMKDIMAGPGTNQFTHAVAALKAFGFIPTDVNDPIAIRQEVVKKLNAYVSSNPVGQRSDASQTLLEASSPSPNIQILPALTRLAKDAVAQDRTIISKPGAFTSDDLSQYGKHTSTYSGSIDQQAMQLDQMEPKERQSLLDKMKKEATTTQGKKFWNTLRIIKQQGLFNVGQ